MPSRLNQNSRVAIVGAGPCGLSAAKHILDQGVTNVTLYEKTNELGGVWRYNANAEDEHATPMYQNLKINVPAECMGFIDMPFTTKNGTSFCGHDEVLHYLKTYAETFKILEKIQFSTPVERVDFANDEWRITTTKNASHSFDFVVLANGHYSTPDIPPCFNGNVFEGEIIHASSYRVRDSQVCLLARVCVRPLHVNICLFVRSH